MNGPHNWNYDVVRRVTPLTRWDSGWYVSIVESGYQAAPTKVGQQTNHAFFPLYPLLIRAVVRTTGIETSLAGNIISGLCLLGLLVLFAEWVERNAGPKLVRPALLTLLFFPTSFFFAAVYAESLLLLLALLAVNSIQRGGVVMACIAGYLSGLTRVSGIVLAPYLVLTSLKRDFDSGTRGVRAWTKALLLGVPPLAGFGTFCLYFYIRFQNPLLFFTAQHNWGETAKTSLDGPILIWNAVVTDITTGRIFYKSPARTLEGIFLLLFFVLAGILLARKHWNDASYVGMTSGIVLASGTLESAGRYVLPGFPGFALLAELSEKKKLWISLLVASALTQAAYIFVFVHWLWAG